MDQKVIRDLIESNGLVIYGQPKWTFGKNTCNTYELFVEKICLGNGRVEPAWPLLGRIEQDEDLSLLFSGWFLRNAMNTATELARGTDANVTFSVNLLPLHANRESFVAEVLSLLAQTGMCPRKLFFEVSEAQTLTDRGVENLNLLHDEHGVGLVLANFGTGHSNIDLLLEVHFDSLELDRSYTARVPHHDQTCRVIVGIVQLAHTLDMTVCAKGIENQEQFEFFEELDCDKGQGFLIGKPMDMEALKEYIGKYALKRMLG